MIDAAVISADQNANDESLNIKALQETALKLWAIDQASALDLGRALIAVRDAMTEHGAFAKWFREAGMEESRVYYCIRKAEGKVKSGSKEKEQEPAFLINERNLAVGRAVPVSEGRFAGPRSIHVGKQGTTATDGYVLLRVSLAPNSPVPENEGLLPLDRMPLLSSEKGGGKTAAVSFGKTATTIRDCHTNTTTTFPADTAEFPPVDRLLKSHQGDLTFQYAIRADILHRLASAAKDFDSTGYVLLQFGRGTRSGTNVPNVRCHMTADGQSWYGEAAGAPLEWHH